MFFSTFRPLRCGLLVKCDWPVAAGASARFTDVQGELRLEWQRISIFRFVLQFVPQVEAAPVSSWSPSPRSTDSSPVSVGMKRARENGQEPEVEMEPAPKKAFGFEMKLSSNLVSTITHPWRVAFCRLVYQLFFD